MAQSSSHVCFSKNSGGVPVSHLDPVDENLKAANAIMINPRNSTLNTAGPTANAAVSILAHEPLQLAMTTRKLWNSGRKLKVNFKAGTEWQKRKVKEYAPQWSKFANITFDFDTTGTPDILVDFNPALGSWSLLGTDSVYTISKKQPSMNLGWVLDSRKEAEIRQVVLHEFGHALAAVHEHSNPMAKIPWNKDQIYKDLGGPPNSWSKDMVDKNMFTVYDALEVPSTAFDIASIMLYQYPKSWLLNGEGTPFNTQLSDHDKSFIAFCYPKNEYDAGHFNTLQSQSQGLLGPSTESVRMFDKEYTEPPPLSYGLYWLDLGPGADVHVRASTKKVENHGFTAAVEALSGTKLVAAGMTWLETPRFPYLQTGSFSTEQVRPWSQPRANTIRRINFPKSFSSPPKVVCFFTALHIADGHDWRAKVSPSSVDEKGFTINVSTWSDTILYSSEVTWLAHPSDQPNATSGRFSTTDAATAGSTQTAVSAAKSWEVQFTKNPKIFLALDELDYEHGKELKCKVGLSNVTPTEMTWVLQAGGSSVMRASGGSFFAWE
ncbi:MAG: hypothetical protein L6R41_003650 [Letrouitia leprolyta]|nr:MAG: hypothetical protein L6R41_003650 [Letrouitia leprolyta]